MTLAILFATALGVSAAPVPAPALKPLPGESVDLKAADGWQLKAIWQKAQPGKPTLLLLHGTGQRKEDWRLFARAAARAGFGYMAVDLRGHGESRTTPAGEVITWKKMRATKAVNDFADMSQDVEAAAAWLATQGVAEESIGLVGAEVGGSVAIKHAAVHAKSPFVVVLSPSLAWQEIPIVNAVRAYKNRPILMIHSEADKRSSKETPLLYEFAKRSAGERNAVLLVVAQERGTRLFKANKGLAERVLAWAASPGTPEALAVSTANAPSAALSTGDPAE